MKIRKMSLKQIEKLPTLHVGQFDDLKIETADTRVWLSRMTIEDGQPYNNQVTEEKLEHPHTSKGVDQTQGKVWTTVRQYEAT